MESDWERFNIGNLEIWHVPTKLKKTYPRIKMVTPYGTLRTGDVEDNDVEDTTLRTCDFEDKN